jgi:Uncharacterised nucleotidyltransferase
VGNDPGELLESLKRAASALRQAGIGFAVAGGAAAYARGAAMPTHDVDFVLCLEDVDTAAKALAGAGLRIAHPPEDWLIKAYDGDNMIDLIHQLAGRPVTPGLLGRADELEVAAVRVPVLDATDLVVSWLRAFSEHHADFAAALTSVRPLREQVDWRQVRSQSGDSPFARAFLVLLEELGIVGHEDQEAR